VINARLFGNGQVAATATSEALTFANVNAMNVVITTKGVTTANGTTIGGNGLLWHEGDVVVTATPALFTGNVGTVNAPKVTVAGSVRTMTAVAGTNSFTATFPKADAVGGTKNGVAGVTNDNLVATVAATATSGGSEFPGGQSEPIRLDNAAPNAGTIVLPASVSNNFIGANFAFSSKNFYVINDGAVAAADAVPGTGIAKYEFFVGDNNATNQGLTDAKFVAANPKAITNSDELNRSITNNAYLVVVRVTDFAGNAAYTRLGTSFGVDLDRPSITKITGPKTNTIAASGDQFVVERVDTTSGFGDTAFEYKITRTNANTTICVNVGSPNTEPPCKFIASGSGTYTLPNLNGYYQIDVRVRDKAGNVSDEVSRFVLVDDKAPTASVGGFNIANTTVGLTGTLNDNVDLAAYDVRLGFNLGEGQITLPFVKRTEIGAFGLPILAEQAVSGSTPLILSLQDGVGGDVFQVSSAGFGAYDVAGNFGFAGINITSPTVGGSIANTLKAFDMVAGTTICGSGTPGTAPCGNSSTPIPSTRTVTATAKGQTGTFNNPFARVLFYRLDSVNGEWQLIGEAGTPTSTDTGSGNQGRTYSYTTAFNAAGFPIGAVPVIAVGIDAKNQAIVTAPTTFDVK